MDSKIKERITCKRFFVDGFFCLRSRGKTEYIQINGLKRRKEHNARGVQFNFGHFYFCNRMKTMQLSSLKY